MRINITLLSYDHGILRQVFDVMEYVVQNGETEKHRDLFPPFADFTIRFMDEYHHKKEEQFVFPLAADGPDKLKEMMPELIDDHRKARSFADAITKDVGAWDREGLAKNTLDLVKHMRHHILEEEDYVFPTIDGYMDPDQDLELWQESQKFLADKFGEAFPSDMESWANEMQEKVWGKGVIKAPSR
ncbi:hemerythrin domain-containing protein [Methanomassiliicoccus luminyensis]|jgi:hemerythrin-like domain-containing protein|uniref:hemerythrin domain-containing protein n=1 Tax=Methanomassiliicoccus luminyensis TaxID=1080712 RepID=UPI0003634AE0|nr:hemerythrin domain-containing protein [Methanomassiliicoccus luminyensis]